VWASQSARTHGAMDRARALSLSLEWRQGEREDERGGEIKREMQRWGRLGFAVLVGVRTAPGWRRRGGCCYLERDRARAALGVAPSPAGASGGSNPARSLCA
jgi:hypothetical protein